MKPPSVVSRKWCPRSIHSTLISDATFDAWTCGLAALLPRQAEYGFDSARLAGADVLEGASQS